MRKKKKGFKWLQSGVGTNYKFYDNNKKKGNRHYDVPLGMPQIEHKKITIFIKKKKKKHKRTSNHDKILF